MSEESDGGVESAKAGQSEREALMREWGQERQEIAAQARPAAAKSVKPEPRSMEFDPDDDGLGPVERPAPAPASKPKLGR